MIQHFLKMRIVIKDGNKPVELNDTLLQKTRKSLNSVKLPRNSAVCLGRDRNHTF